MSRIKRRLLMTLPTTGAPPTHQYSMPNPDVLREVYTRVHDAVYHDDVVDSSPHADDLRRVLMLAQGYLTLTTYELGQECCVGKLRDIWRERRRRGDE